MMSASPPTMRAKLNRLPTMESITGTGMSQGWSAAVDGPGVGARCCVCSFPSRRAGDPKAAGVRRHADFCVTFMDPLGFLNSGSARLLLVAIVAMNIRLEVQG